VKEQSKEPTEILVRKQYGIFHSY